MSHSPRYLLPLFICLTLATSLASAEPAARMIEVSGLGKIFQAPDTATTSFSFSQRSMQTAQGKALIDTQVTNLLKLCEKLGIETADIQAANLSVYPQYDFKRNRELIGYQVTREVRVKVRNLQQYPALLDGAVKIGATHSGSLSLDFSNREELEQQAMLKAFEQAELKANLLAKKAKAKLGEVMWISESGQMPAPIYHARAMNMAESADASYPTGEVEINKTLLVRFSLH